MGHPSGYYSTEATVSAIGRDDLVDFHARYFQPGATIIAISGDFDGETRVAMLEAALGDWPAAEVERPQLPAFNPTPTPRVY